MGGQSSQEQKTTQQSSSQPWEPALPAVNNLLSQSSGLMGNTGITPGESSAISGLNSNAQSNPYAQSISGLANGLLTGSALTDRSGYATNGYNQAQTSLTPIANQNTDPYQNEAFTKATGVMTNDIMDRIKSQYAGAGYSPTSSGDFGQQVGRGVAQGIAPAYVQAQSDLTNQRMGAANSLYNNGNATSGLLSGLDQTALGNRQAGISVAGAANDAANQPFMQQLQAAAMQRGIPIQNLGELANLIIPMAQLGTQQQGSGTGNTTAQMSGAEQFQRIAGGLGSLSKAFFG